MVFMPRIDLWAVETIQQTMEDTDPVSTDPDNDYSGLRHNHGSKDELVSGSNKHETAYQVGDQAANSRASSAWSLFVEQVESICVSTSVTILVWSQTIYTLTVALNRYL